MVVLTAPKYIDNSKADLISVYTTFAGNFLPVENCSLIMTNANVIFNIDYPVLHNTIDLNFNGNYTIYNPNESLNMTLVAPFSPDFKNLESTCLIKIGGTVAPFSFVEYNLYESPWEQYLTHPYGMSGIRKFIVINATFPENDSIDIEFSFNAYIANPSSRDELIIFYDVGTSRAWNGTISEHVEFKVHGKLPDSYSTYRKDFFEQAGLDPEGLDTWNDLVVYGKKLTKKDASGKVVRWGVGIGGDLAQYYYNWIWQAGGSLLNEDYTEATLDTEAGREALQFLVDLVHKHKVAPIDPALDPSYDWLGEYSANHLAILPLTSPIKQFIEHNAPHLTEVTIARRPPKNKLRVSFQGAGYFGLLYGTKDVDAAMQWLSFLARTEVQRRVAITMGQISPCQPALDDPYYTEDWWFKGHVKALPYGRTTQHPNPAWGAITNPKPGAPIYDMMVNALSGRVGVEEAIKTAQEGMQELIRSYEKEKK